MIFDVVMPTGHVNAECVKLEWWLGLSGDCA